MLSRNRKNRLKICANVMRKKRAKRRVPKVGPAAGALHEGKESPREETVKVSFRASLCRIHFEITDRKR